MKRTLSVLIIFFVLVAISKAQTIVDFDSSSTFKIYASSNYAIAPAIVSNPYPSGMDASKKVLHIAKNKGTFEAYTKVLFNSPLVIPTGSKLIMIDVWTSVDSANFYFKAGNNNGGNETFFVDSWMGAITGHSWKTLSIDLTNLPTTMDLIYLLPGCWLNNNACPTANGDYWITNIRFVGSTPTSVNSIDNNHHSLIIFPNPAKQTITINNNRYSSISIYDLTGHVVYSSDFIGTSINISALVPGCYFIKVIDSNQEVLIDRFIKN